MNPNYPPQFNPYLQYVNQNYQPQSAEMFNVYMQQMGGAWQMQNASKNESLDQTMASDEGSRDSGNDTVSPSLLNHSSQPTSSAVSPHYPDPHQNPNPYAIHNLLGAEDKENKPPAPKPYQLPPTYNPMMFLPSIYAKDLCVVCGDTATGHHYGVLSCEGCKGFFRRSVNKGLTYVCQKGANCQFSYQACQANRGIRTRCQACRYKRCIEVGMNKANVRVAPAPAAQAPAPTAPTQLVPSPSTNSPISPPIPPPIRTIINAYTTHLPDTTKLSSPLQAVELIQKFFAAAALTPEGVEKVVSGLLWLRVAYSFDDVAFFTPPTRAETIERLRSGIRNNAFADETMALIFALYSLQSKQGSEMELYKSLCECLQKQLTVSHPNEPYVYEVLYMNLFKVTDFSKL